MPLNYWTESIVPLQSCSVYTLTEKKKNKQPHGSLVSVYSAFIFLSLVTFVIDPGTSRSISLHKTTPSLSDALRNPSGSAMFFLGELSTPREMSQVTVCSSGFMAARAALLQHTGRCALLLLLLPTSATLLLWGTALKTSSEAQHQPWLLSKGILHIPASLIFPKNQTDLSRLLWNGTLGQICFKCEKMRPIVSFIQYT